MTPAAPARIASFLFRARTSAKPTTGKHLRWMLLHTLLITPAMPVSLEKSLYGNFSDTGNGARRMRRGRRKALRETNIDALRAVGSCKCFVAGTKVKTDHGFLPIEQIKPGMRVLAWNEKTGQLTYSLVQQTFVRTANEIYRVKYDDGTLVETTWSHPFYVTGKGWVKGRDLRPGMKSPTAEVIAEHNQRMAMSGGYRLPVEMVSFTNNNTGKREASVLLSEDLPGAMTIETVEVLPGKETVYNFSVEDAHSFFVGEDEVLVHNEQYPNLNEIVVSLTAPINATRNYFFWRTQVEDAQARLIRQGELSQLSTGNGEADAFRHAYWGALMQANGESEYAEAQGDAHEANSENAMETQMDRHNNAMGRRIALDNPNVSDEELERLVREAANKGQLMVIVPHPELLEQARKEFLEKISLAMDLNSGQAPSQMEIERFAREYSRAIYANPTTQTHTLTCSTCTRFKTPTVETLIDDTIRKRLKERERAIERAK